MHLIQKVGLYAVLGVLAGGLGVLLQVAIEFLVRRIFFWEAGSLVAALMAVPWWYLLTVPIFGALAAGVVARWLGAPYALGEGVPELVSYIASNTVLPRRAFMAKLLTTVLTLGTGGSGGREGPLVFLGGALAVLVARIVQLRPNRTLLAGGAAAAMAGAFLTPVAAVLFAIEVLRVRMRLKPVLLVSVLAAVGYLTARYGWQYDGFGFLSRLVGVLPLSTLDPETVLVVFIGGVTLALTLRGLLYVTKRIVGRLVPWWWLRPAVGGVGVGMLALVTVYLYEPLFATVLQSAPAWPLGLLLLVLVVKLLATALTVGSGGSGGIFAPALMLGWLIGLIGMQLGITWWAITPSLWYPLIGMVVVFAATVHAPLSAAVLIIEITDVSWVAGMVFIALSYLGFLLARLVHKTHAYSASFRIEDSTK